MLRRKSMKDPFGKGEVILDAGNVICVKSWSGLQFREE